MKSKRGATLTAKEDMVLETMRQSSRPLTAYALLAHLRGQGFSSPVQVYRTLTRLQAEHKVHRLESLNAYVPVDCKKGSDLVGYFVCDTCQMSEPYQDRGLSEALLNWLSGKHFSHHRTILEVLGTCKSCAAQVTLNIKNQLETK